MTSFIYGLEECDLCQKYGNCEYEGSIKVLSLFDGMACGMLALMVADIQVERYVAYEIDEYAIQTSTHNFPSIEHRGDVFEGDFTEFYGFDLLMGGSPCTYWSIAQSPDKRETTASGLGWELFCQYVRALREAKPKYFIYENNKSMSNAIRESITETFGFEPICINSALVSAQNRQRLYWVGKRDADGTYSKVNVEQPTDRGILLKDVLESGCNLSCNNKAYAHTASYNGAVPWNTIERKQRTMVVEPVIFNKPHGFNLGGAKYDKTPTLTANGSWQSNNFISEPVRVGALPRPNGKLSTSQAFRIYDISGKAVSIKANCGGAGGKTGLYAVPAEPCEWNAEGVPTKAISVADGKAYTVYEVKNGIITIKGKEYPIKLSDGFYIIRKLTVRECMRLQTVPEWYEFPVSNTQAYRMLGNGWTVDVIVHLLNSAFA